MIRGEPTVFASKKKMHPCQIIKPMVIIKISPYMHPYEKRSVLPQGRTPLPPSICPNFAAIDSWE
jgi:hypothetical protein